MVCAIVFAETGLLVGFVLPGDSLLIVTGVLAFSGVIGLNVWLVALAIGALLWATGLTLVGYLLGYVPPVRDVILAHTDLIIVCAVLIAVVPVGANLQFSSRDPGVPRALPTRERKPEGRADPLTLATRGFPRNTTHHAGSVGK